MFPLRLFVTIVFGSHHVLCQKNTEKTRMSSSAPPTQCVFNSFLCKPSGLAVVKTLMNISSVSECQETCQGNKNCNFVTFTNFRNIATCHLLSSCEDKVWSLLHITTFNEKIIHECFVLFRCRHVFP